MGAGVDEGELCGTLVVVAGEADGHFGCEVGILLMGICLVVFERGMPGWDVLEPGLML